MRAWFLLGLLLPLAAAPAASAQPGCAALFPAPPGQPVAILPGVEETLSLRHTRPSTCLNPPPTCPDSGSQVTFTSSGSPHIQVSFSPSTAPASPSGSQMEARSTARLSLQGKFPNASLQTVTISAGCGAHRASQTYSYATPPIIDVTWGITERVAGSDSMNWTVRFTNRGSLSAFVDIRAPQRYNWTGVGHTIVVGGLTTTRPSNATVKLGVDVSRPAERLALELLVSEVPSGEGARNHTLVLFEPEAFRGRARLPAASPAAAILLLGVVVLMRRLRERPA